MVDACAWKSGRKLVPQEQIEALLRLLLEAENRRWLGSISPVNTSDHDDLQPHEDGKPNCYFTDVGSHLLRHGECIDRIHSYFHHVEPNHYCLKATTNDKNPGRPSSQMKVVSNDDSLTDSTRSDSTTAQETDEGLNHRHPSFELYKNALLCAMYPVLSASEPASPSTPYSPTLSLSTVSPSSDGRISSEISFPNLSDTLQRLVMKVFALKKKNQQYLRETVIPKHVPQAKDPPRLLVETLLSQRVVLERNHHPFYSVQAFMDKNAYSEWVMMEKDKIECLINSFWHKAYPPVPELPLEDQEFHKQYQDLMKRLIRCESKSKELHPVHDGVTPTSPLSSPACQLLKEFQLRYGIGLLFCKISYLDYLVKFLENTVWYLCHVAYCLQDLMKYVTSPEIYVESEFKLLLSILSELLSKTKYALTRIRKIFPENSPKDGVPALVALFKLSLESSRLMCSDFSTLHQAHVFSSNLPSESLSDILASYLKTEMNSRYERLKVIAVDQLGQDRLSPQLMIKLILEIRLEVKDYDTFYSVAFSSYFDMKELAAIQFYSLLMSDVEQLCANPPRDGGRGDVETNMLCLAFRLSKLDKDWAKFIPFSHQIWRQPFQDFALQWLDTIGRWFRTLVPQLTRHDRWRAVEGNFTVSPKGNCGRSQGRPLPQRPMGAKSPSLGSLIHSQNSAFNSVGPSTSGLAKTRKSNRMACNMKGKEPLKSRKYTSGSRPIPRSRGPKPYRPGMAHDSSSDEDTSDVGSSSLSKDSHVQQVVAQIHEPRAGACPGATAAKAFHEDGSSKKVASAGRSCEVLNDNSLTSVEVQQETRRSPGNVEQVVSTSSDRCNSSKSQDLPGNIDNSVRIRKDSKEHDFDGAKTSSLEPKATEPEAIGPFVLSERSQQVDGSEYDKAEQSGNAKVRPFKRENRPDENNADQASTLSHHPWDITAKGVESSASNASLDKNCIPELPTSGSHSEDAHMERLKKIEKQSSTSASSKNVSAQHEQENSEEGFVEVRFRSNCPRNPSGSGTPFENDSTGESGDEPAIRSSEIQRDVSAAGPSVGSNSLLYSYRQEPEEDNDKIGSNPRPAPALSVVGDVQPIEDVCISNNAKGSSDSCESCPSKDICVESDKRKKRASSCDVGGAGSNSLKAAQHSQSAPIIIPTVLHKHIARLLDTPGGSIGSTLSDCGSFLSAPGSFMSSNSIKSFHTARSKSSSSQSHHSTNKENSGDQPDTLLASQTGQSTILGDSDDQTGSDQSPDNAPQVLPISSSFVDVLCAVNRLASFVCHLCGILCPDDKSDEHVDIELRQESLGIKRRLCNKLFQVILEFVKLFSDNVLGMEVCGLPEADLVDILDERVWRHLTLQREAGQLHGCRYNPSARQFCNTRDSDGLFNPPCEAMSRTEENPGQYEPVTQQMGVRISNVAIFRDVLPWLSEHVVTVVNSPDSLLSTHDYFEKSSESEVSYSLSYCENGPSLAAVANSIAAEAARCDAPQPTADQLYDQGMLNGDLEHFCSLETAQVKVVTYRVNKFFKQVLRYLLDLNLPYGIRKRLKPAMDFLSCELRRFHGVLYADSFNKLLTEVWAAVTENFKEESQRLFRRRSSASEHCKLLFQAVAYLMEFFHAGGIGLAYDKMAAPLDPTVKHMQLYTSPTDKLISMYHSLCKQVLIMQRQYRVDERTSSVSVSSHQTSANAPADFVMQALCKDLHKTRKCFTGAQLVDWVKDYVRNHGQEHLGVCIGSTETNTGMELGRYLLDHGVIICVSPPPRFNQQATPERTGDDDATDSIPTERGTVFVRGALPPDIRINDITFSTRSGPRSPQSSSCSTSRSTTVHDSESQHEADDEYEDEDDFLGNGSDLWTRTNSALSESNATFYNHHKAFYKFVCEEDSSRTEIKITLGFSDRLNLPAKLKNILCVLYARKDSDKGARNFLKRLPIQLLDEAIGGEGSIMCYGVFRACQTL